MLLVELMNHSASEPGEMIFIFDKIVDFIKPKLA